jgi:phosphodiesterase/alkaline phosphatase D-like protein
MSTVASASGRRWLDEHLVTDRVARRLRWLAWCWAPLAALAAIGWVVRNGVPAEGEAGFWELLALAGILLGYLLGWLVSFRFPMVGGTVLGFFAVTAGVLAALEEAPARAVWATVLLFVPALALWLAWQRTHALTAVALLAALLGGLLAVGGWAADTVWTSFYGPQHPQSPLSAGPPTPVRWIWTGGVTTTAATVVLRVAPDAASVDLAASAEGDAAPPTVVGAPVTGDPGVWRFTLDGLAPATTWTVTANVDGTPDETKQATFRTAPLDADHVTVAFGSCSRLGSSGAVYDTIREAAPDLFLATGDWYYADISGPSIDAFRGAYDATLTSPAQAALYRSVPVAYVWDDHDYGPNDANRTSASRPAAMQVYRERVPSYPLHSAGDEGPIHQAFSWGPVRFVLTDGRSAKDPQTMPDGPDKTMLGAEQRAWLEAELVASAPTHALVVLVTSVPWIAPAQPGADHWGGYAVERQWLADVIAEHGITNLVLVAGDAHMIAADDGTNSDYATGGGAGMPVLHAAALDRPGSEKGGPYSEGAFPGAGQFGLLDVQVDGADVTATFTGLRWDGSEVLRYEWTVPAYADASAGGG